MKCFACLTITALLLINFSSCNNQRVPPFELGQDTYSNSIGMEFVYIEPGTFQMGTPRGEPQREGDELQHEVEITEAFYIGKFEVTQEQYQQIMGENPSWFQKSAAGSHLIQDIDTSKLPVENITWQEAVEFCKKLGERERGAAFSYRLPTEAEWEYACRAGTTTPMFFGTELNGDKANCRGRTPYPPDSDIGMGKFLNRTTVIGKYPANEWGLYDMAGNVWEWCSDWYDSDYYEVSPRKDPQGPHLSEDATEKERNEFQEKYLQKVIRGGCWATPPNTCRSGNRNFEFPNSADSTIGFRVVLVPKKQTSN